MRSGSARWNEIVSALRVRGKAPTVLTEALVEAALRRPLGLQLGTDGADHYVAATGAIEAVRYSLPDGKVAGLVLDVGSSATATFALLYRFNGVRCRYTIGRAGAVTVEVARGLAAELLGKVARGIDPAQEKRQARAQAQLAKTSTVRAYLRDVYSSKVLAHHKDGGHPVKDGDKPSGTHARILAAWEQLLDVSLPALTRDSIEKVLAKRKKDGRQMGTLLRDWSAFRALLADAVDRGQLASIPMARRPEPIRKGKGNQRVRWLGQVDQEGHLAAGEGEVVRFNRALEAHASNEVGGGDFLRFAARLALATGMRRGEIVRLADAMINLRERTITLPASVTKSNRGRVVYLNDRAIAALKGWTLRGTRGEFCPGSAENWEDRITQREWPELSAAATLVDLHFHDLRHDFAVRMLRSGATLEQVRDALGHASITQTEKYAHVMPSDVRKAVLGMA